uniref:Uncharacterized protein n=1 Tax=Arundo donax TaxID=35708 RepID=A0A0A9RUW4_ARUDO
MACSVQVKKSNYDCVIVVSLILRPINLPRLWYFHRLVTITMS